MEGISIGEYKYVGLNFKVYDEDRVFGWIYDRHPCDAYRLEHGLALYPDEVYLGPKCLIEW